MGLYFILLCSAGGTTFEKNPDFNLESGFFVISPFETRKTHS